MKIFLGDLTHDWKKQSLRMFPLNLGYVAAYAYSILGESIDIRIFKSPQLLLDKIREEQPDVVGLSYYVWNLNLNKFIMETVKHVSPDTLTLGGGPIFTPLNTNKAKAEHFFKKHSAVDIFCLNQGEIPFANTLAAYENANGDLDKMKSENIPGTMINNLKKHGSILIDNSVPEIKDLDLVPSPYLTGILDPFFEGPFVPLLETNRSCPYRCTFCSCGIGTQKFSCFSEERVMQEIEYVCERSNKTLNLYITDTNFGILERDVSIAERLFQKNKEKNYPGYVLVSWNKSNPARLARLARALGDLTEVRASLQSTNPDTLKAIKRTNLSFDQIIDLRRTLSGEGHSANTASELIVGLPYETWDSHMDANRSLISAGIEVVNYNLQLIPGTEMDSESSRNEYFKHTGVRLFADAYGIYDGQKIFEGEEVVTETSTMTKEETASIRFVHILIMIMWSKQYYFDFLNLVSTWGIHPVDFAIRVAQEIKKMDRGSLSDLFCDFSKDLQLEEFESTEEVINFWSKDKNFNRLIAGEYGKLNYQYGYRIILHHRNDFDNFLLSIARTYIPTADGDDNNDRMRELENVMRFTFSSIVNIMDDGSFCKSFTSNFEFDILKWKNENYKDSIARNRSETGITYEFYLSDAQCEFLDSQIKQYSGKNAVDLMMRIAGSAASDKLTYNVRKI